MTAQRTTKQQILDAIVDLHNAALIASMRTGLAAWRPSFGPRRRKSVRWARSAM